MFVCLICSVCSHQLSDTRVDTVSDSTAELIRLGETSSYRVPSKVAERKETSDHLPDSTSGGSAPVITGASLGTSRVDNDGAAGGVMDGQRSIQGSGRPVLRDAAGSQRSESAGIGSGYATRYSVRLFWKIK